jgi:hypothetical protein
MSNEQDRSLADFSALVEQGVSQRFAVVVETI